MVPSFRMLVDESFDVDNQVIAAGVIQCGDIELNDVVEIQSFGKNPNFFKFRSIVKNIERHPPLGIALFLETDWQYNWWLKHKADIPKHSIITTLNLEKTRSINDGSSSDNPIIVRCSTCSAFGTIAMKAPILLFTGAYCYPCKKWFPYTYEIGKWYFSDAKHSKHSYITRYLGLPSCWEWNTEIKIGDTT